MINLSSLVKFNNKEHEPEILTERERERERERYVATATTNLIVSDPCN